MHLIVLLARFLNSWTSFSHKAVFDMEIQFFHERFSEKDPKLLIDHIQRMASGEAPFFSATLSLVYQKLAEKVFPKHTPNIASPPDLQVPAPVPDPAPTSTTTKWSKLKCARCDRIIPVTNLYNGLHCPHCPDTGKNGRGERGRPFMRCADCNTLRDCRVTICLKSNCWCKFM